MRGGDYWTNIQYRKNGGLQALRGMRERPTGRFWPVVRCAPAGKVADREVPADRIAGNANKGGSASQMQRWKEQLRAAEGKFRELDCSDYRRELR